MSYTLGSVKRDEDGELPTDELIMFYHQEFVKALKAVGFMKPIPSLLDLNVELLKHGAINCLLIISFVPFAFVDWTKISVEDMFTGDSEKTKSFKKSLFEIPLCKKVLQREMKSWLHKGWL